MRRGFSLIELILAITICSIIFMITTNMTISLFKNYIQSNSISRLEFQTQLVLNQISKRIENSIFESIIARSSKKSLVVDISSRAIDDDFDVIEFIPYDVFSFDSEMYSGVVDMDRSSKKDGLFSPGSNFLESIKIFSSQDERVDFQNRFDIAVIFKGVGYLPLKSFGYLDNHFDIALGKVVSTNTLELKFQNSKNIKYISEQYNLSYTANAISIKDVSSDKNNKDFELILHYNYRPWLNEKYSDKKTLKSVLARNVSMFKFKGDNNSVILKLCMRDNQKFKRALRRSANFDFTVCKTKVIF